LAED
jgi:hypothetical protein